MSELRELDRQANRRADLEHALEAVEALKSSEGWKRWLGLRRHFHRYSLANQLLIALQKPEATRVAGFRAWLNLGYCVKRGEKALRIWVPISPGKPAMDEWERNGAIAAERPRTRFKLGPVFDTLSRDLLRGVVGRCGSAVEDARQRATRRSHGGAGEEPGGRRARAAVRPLVRAPGTRIG
jgi:hypothetical protein